MVKDVPKATVTWTPSIYNDFSFRMALWNQLNQMLLYSAVELPVKLIRKGFLITTVSYIHNHME